MVVPLEFCCKKIKDTTTWVSFKKINTLPLGINLFLFIKNNLIIFVLN